MPADAPSLSVRVEPGPRPTVWLSGELDVSGSDPLQKVAVNWPRNRNRVLVELTQIDFIDSSGLRALLDFSRQLAQVGCVMDTRAPPGSMVRLLIDLTSTQRLLRLER